MDKSNLVLNLQEKYESNLYELDKVKHNGNDLKSIFALGYYFRIIENTKGIIILLKENNINSAIMPIFRATLEAVIDLDNILNVDGYIEYLNYLSLTNKLRPYNNEYLKKISMDPDLYEFAIKTKEKKLELKKILNKNFEEKFLKDNKIYTRIDFKFELSGNLDSYKSLYWILCTHTHNDILSIEESYIKKSINQNIELSFFNETDLKEVEFVCATMEKILDDSQNILFKILNYK